MFVGDHFIKNNYRFGGIPDGLGVNKENNSKIKIYINHEIANDKGIVRSHGGKGAFVSQWMLNLNSLKVISGEK